jgi:AcrR family transcriptional regulator
MEQLINEELSKGERTRAALLEAAYVEFTTRGYHGTSMRNIAAAAGLAVGGIYNHFSSKDAIFEAVILAYHPLMRVIPRLSTVSDETTEQLLQKVATELWDELERYPRLFTLLMIELIECEGRHIPTMAESVLPQLMRFIESISTRANLRPMPPLAFAQLFMGMLFAKWFTTRLLQSAGIPATALADNQLFIDVLLHGVQPASSSPNL